MAKYKSYTRLYKDYLKKGVKLGAYQKMGVLLLMVVITGFIGWLWEFCLQEISGGFQHLYIKGGNLLPWINVYAYGAVLIVITTYWLRQRPFFGVSGCGCSMWDFGTICRLDGVYVGGRHEILELFK